MNQRALAYQALIFSVQWLLMIAGFVILVHPVLNIKIFESNVSLGEYVDAGIKAMIAFALSVVWLFLWDKQVRLLFYRKTRRAP